MFKTFFAGILLALTLSAPVFAGPCKFFVNEQGSMDVAAAAGNAIRVDGNILPQVRTSASPTQVWLNYLQHVPQSLQPAIVAALRETPTVFRWADGWTLSVWTVRVPSGFVENHDFEGWTLGRTGLLMVLSGNGGHMPRTGFCTGNGASLF